MVQVLPGFDAQLGQNLASIVDSVQNVIDPDYQLKKQIHQKVLSDPAYAQQLGNFAFANPEVYKQLGLGKIGEVIKGISPDLKTVLSEAEKGFVQKAAKSPNVELAQSAGQTALYGKDEATLRKEKSEEVQAGLNIAVAKQRLQLGEQSLKENDSKLQELALQEKGIIEATKNYPALQKLDLGKIADAAMAGKADASLMSQIASTPQLMAPFQMLVHIREQQRQLNSQREIANLHYGEQRRSVAQDMFIRTRSGTPELWDKYLTDPATQARLVELAADPKKAANATDQMLIQMNDAITEKQTGADAKLIQSSNAAVYKAMLEAADPKKDKSEIAAGLNVIFNGLAEKTGNKFQAKVSTDTSTIKNGWFSTKQNIKSGLQIIDLDTGKPVSATEFLFRNNGTPIFNRNSTNGTPYSSNKNPADASADNTKNASNDFAERTYQAMKNAGLNNAQMLEQILKSKKLTPEQKADIRKRAGI